jgi:hypothetical protein
MNFNHLKPDRKLRFHFIHIPDMLKFNFYCLETNLALQFIK